MFNKIIKKKPGSAIDSAPAKLERPLRIIPRLAVKTIVQGKSFDNKIERPIEDPAENGSGPDNLHGLSRSPIAERIDRSYITDLIAEKTRELDTYYSHEKENAYSAGYERGKIDGFAQGATSLEPVEKLLEGIKKEITAAGENFLKNAEEIMGKLSLEIAEAVVGDAVMKLSGELLEYNLKRCLEVLGGSGDVTIKISPADYELAREKIDAVFQRDDRKFRFKFVPDSSITPGGCFIESPGGAIDGRIESQFKQIKENFLQII